MNILRMYMYKYIFWDGLYCIIFCMEYFVFFLKELRETVEMGISYALENGGYNFFGFIIWKLKLFMLFFWDFLGGYVFMYIFIHYPYRPLYIYIYIYMYVYMYVCVCPFPARSPRDPARSRAILRGLRVCEHW